MADEIQVSGLSELRDTLRNKLPQALQGKALQRALAKAAKPIVDQAKSLAPTRKPRGFVGPLPAGGRVPPGNLRKSIYSFRNRNSTRQSESRLISVRGAAWYWKFIEFGRGVVQIEKVSLGRPGKGFFGKVVKAVPARPFLRPAFEAMKLQALEIFRRSLAPEIEKVAAQARRRGIRRLTKKLTGI
jgi:HK97 gp10 family phage protein